MTALVLQKLLAICATVALGWLAGRMRWLGRADAGVDPSQVLGAAAFYIFVPALLFRTAARIDFTTLPWPTLAGFFVPTSVLALVFYAWQQRRAGNAAGAAEPAARTVTALYGNAVQLGIPVALAVFGEAGLAIHLALVSVHALLLLTLLTVLAELDLARAPGSGLARRSLPQLVLPMLRTTLIHPVVLPILCGLAFKALGFTLPALADEVLALLGSAVVPLCLVLIGLSLAYQRVAGAWRAVALLGLVKLLLLPAVVLVAARWGFGLSGLALKVVVMMAALPSGSNALIFAQRYQVLQAEASAAIVVSTLAYAATATGWLAVLALL